MKKTLLQAIAQMEGFYNANTRPNRNNNPGDIEWGPFARNHGATKPETLPDLLPGRFAYFPTVQQGWECMAALLMADYSGLTLRQMVFKWAPPDENDSERYLAEVSQMTGLDEDTVIDSYINVA